MARVSPGSLKGVDALISNTHRGPSFSRSSSLLWVNLPPVISICVDSGRE